MRCSSCAGAASTHGVYRTWPRAPLRSQKRSSKWRTLRSVMAAEAAAAAAALAATSSSALITRLPPSASTPAGPMPVPAPRAEEEAEEEEEEEEADVCSGDNTFSRLPGVAAPAATAAASAAAAARLCSSSMAAQERCMCCFHCPAASVASAASGSRISTRQIASPRLAESASRTFSTSEKRGGSCRSRAPRRKARRSTGRSTGSHGCA